ncbi:MAG TPA: aldo/keto reductase [Lactobacillaceae bacterium]|jgi:predicted oxidoreductase
MHYQTLGNGELSNVSSVALGVMRIADKTSDEAQTIVETALENGVNFFDTADIYGGGKSSQVFGQALQDLNVKREDVFIQSKGGIILPNGQINGDGLTGPRYDFSKDHLIAAVDVELQRLQTDYLDVFLLHRPDTLMEPDAIAEAFNELETAGKVRHFGVSNFTPYQVDLLKTAVKQPLVANQLQFGLGHAQMVTREFHHNTDDTAAVDRDNGILSYSRLHKMTIQAWSPFQFGQFAGVFMDNDAFPELNDKLQQLADKYHATKNAVAVAWILRHPAHMQVIVGSMTPSRLAEMLNFDDVQLTNQEWYDLLMAAGNTLP